MKKLFVLGLLFSCLLGVKAQDKYEIKVKVEGLKDTIANMAYYYGKNQYYKDTAEVNSKGEMVFSKVDTLDEGMYSILVGNSKVFDFLVDEQKLSFETTKDHPINDMKVKGGKENELFFEYLRFLNVRQKKATELKKIKEENEKGSKEYLAAEEKLEEVNEEVKDFLKTFYEKNEGTFTYSFLKAMEAPEIPEVPKLENGAEDSMFAFRYYRDHFFDNFDFNDDRLVRTAAYHEKIVFYLERLKSPEPDSQIKACDFILEQVKDAPENYKYTLNYLTSKYERSKQMGMDAVFVHLAKNYFMKGKGPWMTEKQMEKLAERANALDPLLIGKKAPNIIVKDTAQEKFISLYDVKSKYTVVYIWSANCGHCKEATPKLKTLYDKMKDRGVEVFGVGNEFENEDWLEFIRKHDINFINGSDGGKFRSDFRDTYDVYSTPQTYLLDENKVILSKKMDIESLENILEHFMKMDEKEKLTNE